jgi:hypothetical protein
VKPGRSGYRAPPVGDGRTAPRPPMPPPPAAASSSSKPWGSAMLRTSTPSARS